MFLVMCLVALSGFVIAQPIDDLELAAVGEKVENTQKLSDVADDSEDLVGAEHRWGGHRGYGGYGGGYGGYGGGYGKKTFHLKDKNYYKISNFY